MLSGGHAFSNHAPPNPFHVPKKYLWTWLLLPVQWRCCLMVCWKSLALMWDKYVLVLSRICQKTWLRLPWVGFLCPAEFGSDLSLLINLFIWFKHLIYSLYYSPYRVLPVPHLHFPTGKILTVLHHISMYDWIVPFSFWAMIMDWYGTIPLVYWPSLWRLDLTLCVIPLWQVEAEKAPHVWEMINDMV